MKKKAATEYRVPLFDRIFRPKTIRLSNGHTVQRPRSRMPLILTLLAAAIWLSVKLTGFDLGIIARRGHQFVVILSQIFSPDIFNIQEATFTKFGMEPAAVNLLSVFDGRWWQALWHTMSNSFAPKVFSPLWDTLRMSILGSFIGATLALPVAVAASTNINRNKVSVSVIRLLLNMLPAYFTALGTASSAATIPITLAQTKKNGVSDDVASRAAFDAFADGAKIEYLPYNAAAGAKYPMLGRTMPY